MNGAQKFGVMLIRNQPSGAGSSVIGCKFAQRLPCRPRMIPSSVHMVSVNWCRVARHSSTLTSMRAGPPASNDEPAATNAKLPAWYEG